MAYDTFHGVMMKQNLNAMPTSNQSYMSHIKRKPAFCGGKKKALISAVTTQLMSAFIFAT